MASKEGVPLCQGRSLETSGWSMGPTLMYAQDKLHVAHERVQGMAERLTCLMLDPWNICWWMCWRSCMWQEVRKWVLPWQEELLVSCSNYTTCIDG